MKSGKKRITHRMLGATLVLLGLFGALSPKAAAQTYTFNATALTTGAGPQSVIAGDFNGDGRLDLAVANSGDNTISILLGKADGTFRSKVDYATGAGPNSITLGDFNKDGKLDLAVANSKDNTVSVLLGNGNGTFRVHVDFATGGSPVFVTTGDFNADGELDLATANSGDNTVSVLLGNGHGVFGAHADFATGAHPTSVGAGDFNGDSKLDLVATNSNDNTVSILLGNGNGTFQAHVDYATNTGPVSVASADFNADGKLDLAVVDESSNTVSILLGNGNGSFQAHVDYGTSLSPVSVVAGDFNGDGKLDLAVANSACGGAAGPTCLIGLVSIFRGKGDGTFQFLNNYAADTAPASVTAGDFNGDGRLDLAIANNQSNTVSVLLGQGNLGFISRNDYQAGTFPAAVVTGDFNHDGILDLAVPNTNDNTVSIFLGKGQGVFQGAVNFFPGILPQSIATDDFNGDGNPDLVVTNNTNPSTVSVLLGNGDGTFQAPVAFATGVIPGVGQVTTGDLNGDGKVDLAVANFNDGTVSILLGNGDGTFKPHVDFAAGVGAFGVAVGDFNRDGKLDLAITHFLNATVAILLGNGDGTFQTPVAYPTGGLDSFSIIAIDLNGDGRLDLVNANNNFMSPNVSVFIGNGDGTFQPHVDYVTGKNSSNSVSVGDFNHDGKLDLAVAGGIVSILLGNGDGTFQASITNYLTRTSGLLDAGAAVALAGGDFIGNGGLDLAVVDSFPGNSVSVLLNTPTVGLFPSQVSFGNQPVGTASAARRVQLSNPGSRPLTIGSIVAGGDFAQTNNCGSSLAVAANCAVRVTFTPIATGIRTGALTFLDSAPGSPQMVSLTGLGTAPSVALSASSLSFTARPLGTTSTAKTVTLANTGNAPLTISNLAVSGDFTQTNNCGTEVAGGASCTITITFSPKGKGTRAGALSIANNVPSSPKVITLTGKGT